MTSRFGVVWSPQSIGDLELLHGQIAQHDSEAANRYLANVFEAVELLRDHPRSGPALPEVPLEGEFRSLVARKHRVIYRVDTRMIRIYRIWDCRRDPAGLWLSLESAE